MKKHVLSALIGLTFAASSSVAFADDLAQVFQLALQNDPTLQRVDAERRAAQRGVDITKAGFWPQVGFSAGYERSSSERGQLAAGGQFAIIDSTTRGWSAGFNLSQTVFDMNVWDNADISEKQAYQAEVNYLSERQQLMLRVVNAYFTVLERQDDLDFAHCVGPRGRGTRSLARRWRHSAELRAQLQAGRGCGVRDRGRRVQHGVLRQGAEVRSLQAGHADSEQRRVRSRRHLR